MILLYFTLISIGLLSELLAVSSVYKYGSTRLPKIWRPLLLLLLAGFISDFSSLALIFFNSNNYIILYLYGFIEVLFYYFIFKSLSKGKFGMIILKTSSIAVLIILFTEFFLFKGEINNFYSNVLSKIYVIIFSGYYALNEYKSFDLENYSLKTLITLLILSVYSISIFYYSIFEEIIKDESNMYNILWPIPILSTIFLNLSLAINICRKEK